MMEAPVTPVVTRKKSVNGVEVLTPSTSSEKVTVKLMMADEVGEADVRRMDITSRCFIDRVRFAAGVR